MEFYIIPYGVKNEASVFGHFCCHNHANRPLLQCQVILCLKLLLIFT